MSEKHTWNILEDVFKREGFVHHQTTSYSNFLNTGIPRIITEEPDILIVHKNDKDKKYNKYSVSFSDVHIPKPSIMEDRELREFYPAEARQRDLTYDAPICATITETTEVDGQEPEINKHFRVVLGRIPIMLRSSHCHLSNMTPQERIKAGECPYDEGGYFIVKGKERVLISQIRGIYNIPLVIEQKPGDKIKYSCELRSMSEETGHSVLIQAVIGTDENTIAFSLPHIKDNIPVGIVFKALGYSCNDIRDLIGITYSKADRYIRIILNDSYLVEDDNPEITRVKALQYIGMRASNPVKDNELCTYAEQILDNEIFPHMGVTSTRREKVYILGHMVHKLLATYLGLRSIDDRDNYINKRVESPGVLCYELFRQLFKKYISTVLAQIERKKQFPDVMSIIPRLTDITKGFQHCFGTGNWGVPKNSYVRPGVAQILSRLSYGATVSNLRRLSIPVGKESKNAAIRQINPSQIMFICPVECFDPETRILMWDGTVKRAGDIVIGDILIDDLGNPTKVRTTCSGMKEMYDILPTKKNFTQHRVTDNHILTLRIRQHKSISEANRKGRNYTHVVSYFCRKEMKYRQKYLTGFEKASQFVSDFDDDDTIDITIQNYLKLPERVRKNLVLFKNSGINWPTKFVSLDPYILGLWLGDGLKDGKGFALHESDQEILTYWNNWANLNGAVIRRVGKYKEEYRVEDAPLKKFLRQYNILNNKQIPSDYIVNDRETRLKVLAGIIDADGSVRSEGHEIRISQGPNNYKLIDGIYTLAISLGFSCNLSEGINSCTDANTKEKKTSTYREITITGNGIQDIPTLLPRKKLLPPSEKYANHKALFTGSQFNLVETGIGPFVGWQLEDPRGRFTLECGTITHNTPEGAPVGTVLNLSLLTRISDRTPTVLVKEMVEQCENITLMIDFEGPNQETKVFLNGIIIGMSEDSDELVKELKQLRKINMIPWDVSISHDDDDDEIHICSDEGRLLRPVFTVKDGKLLGSEKDGTNWCELLKKGIITYIDNSEANGAVIAFTQKELGKYHNDYCEITPAMMMGVMGNIIPFPDHSQSPRNCYQSAMGKQAMSIFALSHLIRADTVVHVLNTPQRPIVSTRGAQMMGFNDMPSGINAIVAIACYTGYNQEDSVLLNYSAVQRGMFWATTYRTHTESEKKEGYMAERIGVPPLNQRRRDANYGMLGDSGVIRLRHPKWKDKDGIEHGGGAVYVEKGDVIVGKIAIQYDKDSGEKLNDCSLVIKRGEEGYIDRIFDTITPNGYRLVKIVIRKTRIPEIGDKFASRAAQKGTVGMVYRQEDMPFTKDGIVPDIIINPHCIPSRMTINQLMETVLGKSCAIEGDFGDATPFTESSTSDETTGKTIAEQLRERLDMNGYNGCGNEELYNGMTGMKMGEYFIGPVYYQRLKHLVSDKMHARATGPVTTLTRQPLEGRSRDGGKILPQCYLIVVLVCTTAGDISKFRGILEKPSVLSQYGKPIGGSGENSEV